MRSVDKAHGCALIFLLDGDGANFFNKKRSLKEKFLQHTLHLKSCVQKQITDQDDLKSVFITFSQLRTHLTLEIFQDLFSHAYQYEHYKLFGFFYNHCCIALIGMRPYCDFVRGKHLYIDDLIVHEDYRSQGLGAQLIHWVDSYAVENAYHHIRLSTGIDNPSAKNFYIKNDYKNKAIVFVKKAPSSEKAT